MQEEEVVAYFEVLPRNLEELKETTNQVLWSVSLSRFEKRISNHKTSDTAVAILIGPTSLQKLQILGEASSKLTFNGLH